MARFECEESDWDEGMWALYHASTLRAIRGKRGQQALRDLRAALLALPEKKLAYGVADIKSRSVCTLGAGYLNRLMIGERASYDQAFDALLATFPDLLAEPDDYDMNTITEDIRPDIADTMLAEIAFQNDSGPRNETEEQRYVRMLAWIEQNLLPDQGDAVVPAGGSGGAEPIGTVESPRG